MNRYTLMEVLVIGAGALIACSPALIFMASR